MNYSDTVNWMFSQLPMYQNKGKVAFKKDLTNSILLSKHLDKPEHKFKSIHVAGTNGKGSTSHMIASILQEAGYKVGLYTSPHLKDFRERIKINGNCVSKQFVIGFIKRNKSFFDEHSLSFFEMTVGMAFDYFAREKVDISIIEVGLGGRLDSTNIINPEVSIITNIGFDHTQFLGNTLPEIAFEKAGVIKKNVPVVIGETHAETASVFIGKADDMEASIKFADKLNIESYESDLLGTYQEQNIKTAVVAISEVSKKGFNISENNIVKGLKSVISNTGLLGRWQVLQTEPKVIVDTAHNREGLTYTLNQLKSESYDELHIVIGFVSDKDLDSIIDLFPMNATYYYCKPNVQRGLDVNKLKDYFKRKKFVGKSFPSVEEALKAAKKGASKNDLIYVGGSTFVVAEII